MYLAFPVPYQWIIGYNNSDLIWSLTGNLYSGATTFDIGNQSGVFFPCTVCVTNRRALFALKSDSNAITFSAHAWNF